MKSIKTRSLTIGTSKHSFSKRIISLMLAIISIFGVFSTIASATCTYTTNAFDVPTSSKFAKVYTLATSGTTIPYTSKYLSTRGTTNGTSRTAYIDNKTDELYLLDAGVTNGKAWAYVSYPVGSSRRNAYIYLSAISSASYNSNHLYYASSKGKFYCTPRKGGSISKSYYVDAGDKVYALSVGSTSGANVQIMYPVSGEKWRIAYCTYDDAVKYLDGKSHTHNYNGGRYYENAHPHAISVRCTDYASCGGWKWTGEYYKVSGCSQCYPSSSKSYTAWVNTSSSPLVLRKNASTSSTALCNMPKGSQITVLDNKAKTNGFYHVTYNGKIGYASASYVTFTKPTASTSTGNSVSLKVPYFAQNDSRWSSTYIGNRTIGSVGCLLTSISMAYSYKTGTTTYPNTMKSKLKFSNNDFVWSSLSNIGFSRTNYGTNVNQSIYKSIYNHLKAGSPVIYGCGSTGGSNWHWVVITGYKGTSTTSFSASDFIINDPWANSTSRSSVGCRTNLQQYINAKGSYCQCIVYYK